MILEEPIKGIPLVKNFINGEWVESKGEIKDVVNPATCQTIARVPISTRDEIDDAVKAAQEAFPDWRATPPVARARCLFRLKELLEENFEKLAPHINLVMFDLKHMDANTHEKLCGCSNKLILENLKRLCELQPQIGGLEIVIRIPIIPSLNDSKDNIRATAEFISSLGNSISGVELLPYHKLGINKYERLGVQYQIGEVKIPNDEHMTAIKSILEGYGLNVRIF